MKAVVRTCLLATIASMAFAACASADERSAETFQCGVLHSNIAALRDQSANTHKLQIFFKTSKGDRPVLPFDYPAASQPGIACIGNSVLVAAFSTISAHDYAVLAFPDGRFIIVSADEWEFRNGVAIIAARPRLPMEARATIPPEFQFLFDYH
jgi:hypothetical protein